MIIHERSTGSVSIRVTVATSGAFLKSKLTHREREISRLLEISDTPGQWRADALVLDRNLLDRIVDGKAITDREVDEVLHWPDWALRIGDAVEWWNDLARVALEDLLERNRDEANISQRLETMAALEGEVWAALAKARPHQFKDLVAGFEGKDSEPSSRELAKRYRLFTRHIEGLMLEVYPHLRYEALFNPTPKWAHQAA